MKETVARSGAELRAVPADALHVTLVFLGSTAPADVRPIWETVAGAVADLPPPVLAPGGLVGIPRRGPRLLAFDLADQDGRAGAVHAAASDALVGAGLHEAEARPFWPHVTLARARRGGRVRVPDRSPPIEPFVARELTLYSSRTAPTGARYEALERLRLGG